MATEQLEFSLRVEVAASFHISPGHALGVLENPVLERARALPVFDYQSNRHCAKTSRPTGTWPTGRSRATASPCRASTAAFAWGAKGDAQAHGRTPRLGRRRRSRRHIVGQCVAQETAHELKPTGVEPATGDGPGYDAPRLEEGAVVRLAVPVHVLKERREVPVCTEVSRRGVDCAYDASCQCVHARMVARLFRPPGPELQDLGLLPERRLVALGLDALKLLKLGVGRAGPVAGLLSGDYC